MRTVLIAETHLPTAELLAQTLAQAGYRVVKADDTARALELCVAERPDAVVVAADMPRHQGATLGKLIRATPLGSRLPLVAVDKGHLGRAKGVASVLDLMVNAYLPDAAKRQDLLARLDQLISAAAQAPRPTAGVSATLARSPVATGELKARTLLASLHSWHRLARDGVLVLAHRDLTRRVFLLAGSPVNYDSTARQDSLPEWMLSRGLLTPERHQALLDAMKAQNLSPGAALVAVGAVAAGEPLLALLKDWARAKIAEAYAMGEGRYSLYAGAEFASEVPSLELPALGPIYEAARLAWPTKAFANALAAQMKLFPARAPEFSQNLPALGLSTADLKLALTVDGTRTLRELLSGAKDLKHALALFWYLTTVGALRYSPTASAQAAGGAELAGRARPAASRRKALPEEKATELREEAIKVLTGSYFRVLGLDITADAEAVERAYHHAATRFHPDSWAEFELGPIEELLASVQDRLSAAYRVLADEEKRKAYLGYLFSRADVPRSGTPHVEAEVELKRGENLMLKGDWKGALTAFERAVALNAREPEYYSYLAWATFKAGAGDAQQRARAAQRLIKKALSVNATLERPQVIAAIIEDELGDPAEARRTLLRLLKASPNSTLARRALQGLSRKRGFGEKS